jgi:hypothetical protein
MASHVQQNIVDDRRCAGTRAGVVLSDGKSRAPRLIGRDQVARILWGCSIATVRKLEREGKLKPTRIPSPGSGRIRVRFDPEAVHALKPELAHLRDRVQRRAEAQKWDREQGELAARVFEMIRAGKSKVDIVIEAKVPPAAVVELRAEYQKSFADHDRENARERRSREERMRQREHDKDTARREREERTAAERRKMRPGPPAATTLTPEQQIEACSRRVLHAGIPRGSRCSACPYEGKA